MTLEKLVVLIPCSSLEDFPDHLGGQDTQSLLTAWTTLWHPSLVAEVNAMPTCCPAGEPPESVANVLFTIPSASRKLLPENWTRSASEQGAVTLEHFESRAELLELALASSPGCGTEIDPELVADFLALGYGYLQVELLTRDMRYTDHVDDIVFDNLVTKAATAAVAGQTQAAHDALGACFDTLSESRDHFYPVDSYLVDLTLIARSTLGSALRDELGDERCPTTVTNLVMSGATAVEMAERHPETLAFVKRALDENDALLVGGEYEAGPLPLMTHEAILDNIRRGQASYRRCLGHEAKIFGRTRFGLSPLLPGVLRPIGFIGALHFTMDGGRTPHSDQSKANWEGVDAAQIEVLTRLPQNVSEPSTFLNLARRLSNSMERDHVATVVLAHWPGQDSPWFEDLRRVASRGLALGKFVTLEQYFETTETRGNALRFAADTYRWPYLSRWVAEGDDAPISRGMSSIKCQAADAVTTMIRTMTALVGGDGESTTGEGSPPQESDAAALASCLSGGNHNRSDADRSGVLVVNPLSHARNMLVDLPDEVPTPTTNRHVLAVEASTEPRRAVVAVPAGGFAWLGCNTASDTAPPAASRPRAKRSRIPLAAGNVLRNDTMEVTVNETTGAIQAVQDYRYRGNLLSAQIAYRHSDSKGADSKKADSQNTGRYSVMAADQIDVTASDSLQGEITSRGRLLNSEGETLARFVQRLQLIRYRPVLQIDVELDIKIELDGEDATGVDPWLSYFALRFAWADETAELWCSEALTSQSTGARRFVAPHFVDIRGRHPLAILSVGLPFHVRSGPAMLDTLLIAGREQQRKFRLGVAVGEAYPLQAALDLITPVKLCTATSGQPQSGQSGWFFHINRKNVIATAWEPLRTADRITGFRARLLETEGRTADVRLAAFRTVRSARRTDMNGQLLEDLHTEDGCVRLVVRPYAWTQVEAEW